MAMPNEPLPQNQLFKDLNPTPGLYQSKKREKCNQDNRKRSAELGGAFEEKIKKKKNPAEKRGETLQNFKEGKERRAGCKMSYPDSSQINEFFHPGYQPDPMKSAINPLPPIYGTSPSIPHQYQPYAGPLGAIPMQPQQTILITNVQPVNEPDYLGYSIFTLLCCCLPLGIAALVFPIQTQGANQRGDIASAQRYSKVALILDHIALALGIICTILAGIFIFVPVL